MSTWKIDPIHSDMHFKVRHLVISNVTGTFGTYDAEMEASADDFSDAKISFHADVNSISTGMEQRDQHLKSDDFFNAEKYPRISFANGRLQKTGDRTYQLTGDLTIRDVTKTVTLNAEFGGIMADFYGNTKAGFEITGTINRQEFGLKWAAVTEAGGVVVSDEVKLSINAQMGKVN